MLLPSSYRSAASQLPTACLLPHNCLRTKRKGIKVGEEGCEGTGGRLLRAWGKFVLGRRKKGAGGIAETAFWVILHRLNGRLKQKKWEYEESCQDYQLERIGTVAPCGAHVTVGTICFQQAAYGLSVRCHAEGEGTAPEGCRQVRGRHPCLPLHLSARYRPGRTDSRVFPVGHHRETNGANMGQSQEVGTLRSRNTSPMPTKRFLPRSVMR